MLRLYGYLSLDVCVRLSVVVRDQRLQTLQYSPLSLEKKKENLFGVLDYGAHRVFGAACFADAARSLLLLFLPFFSVSQR